MSTGGSSTSRGHYCLRSDLRLRSWWVVPFANTAMFARSDIHCLTRLDLYLHPVLRPQRDRGERLDRMAGNELDAEALRDRGHEQHRFHHRERVADAAAWAAAERQVGEC